MYISFKYVCFFPVIKLLHDRAVSRLFKLLMKFLHSDDKKLIVDSNEIKVDIIRNRLIICLSILAFYPFMAETYCSHEYMYIN